MDNSALPFVCGFSDNLVNIRLNGSNKITSIEYNKLISEAHDLGMTKEEIDQCLKYKNVKFEAQEYCDNLFNKRLGGLRRITQKQYDELLEDLPNIGMIKEELDKCLWHKDVKVVEHLPVPQVQAPMDARVAKIKYLKYKAKYLALKNK